MQAGLIFCMCSYEILGQLWNPPTTVSHPYLIFRGPCIVIYSCNKSQLDALFLKFCFWFKNSTCFGQIYCPSSGVSTFYTTLRLLSETVHHQGSQHFFQSYIYWTVHHLHSWIKRDQLDVTCFIISLFKAKTSNLTEQYNPWNNSTNKSQSPEDGCINIRNTLSIR